MPDADSSRRIDDKGSGILKTVEGIIERDGFDAVDMRRVARDARVSLATIYKHFPSRDAVLLAALEHWMDVHVYGPLSAPDPDSSVADQLVALQTRVFEPWLEHPRMLEAFLRVREGQDGSQLWLQGLQATLPLIHTILGDRVDSDEYQEVLLVCRHVVYSLMWQYARGRLDAEAIVPTLEIAVRRLVASLDGRARWR